MDSHQSNDTVGIESDLNTHSTRLEYSTVIVFWKINQAEGFLLSDIVR